MTRWQPRIDESPVTVVVGDDSNDFYYAMALERCGVPVIWLPHELARGGSALTKLSLETLCRGLQQLPRRRVEGEGGGITLVSLSLTIEKLRYVKRRMRRAVWGEGLDIRVTEVVQLPPYRVSAILDPEHFDDVIDEPFSIDEMVRGVPAAVPSAVTATDPWKLTWWVEVTDPGKPLPSRAALNKLVVADSEGWRAIARCGHDGVSFFLHTMGLTLAGSSLQQMTERPKLRFPSVTDTFQQLFHEAGFFAEESTAGRFRRLTTEMWGGLEVLATDFSDVSTFNLLRAFLSTEASGEKPGVLTKTGRRFLSFEDALSVSEHSPDALRDIIDRLITRGVLRRGLVLKCNRCLHFGWYALESLGQTFRCERCHAETFITSSTWKMSVEPMGYFGIAEVVHQALSGNCEIPIRALAKIASQSRSFGETPEVLVTFADGSKIEIDMLAISNGRIIIGEAKVGSTVKDSGPKERAWLKKLAAVATALAVDEVVFATATEWKERTRGAITAAFNDSQPTNVRLIQHC